MLLLFTKLKENIEIFLATVLVVLAPIACLGLFLIWLFSSIGFVYLSDAIRYITYDIIAPVFVVVSLIVMIIWIPQLVWDVMSYLFKGIKKIWNK